MREKFAIILILPILFGIAHSENEITPSVPEGEFAIIDVLEDPSYSRTLRQLGNLVDDALEEFNQANTTKPDEPNVYLIYRQYTKRFISAMNKTLSRPDEKTVLYELYTKVAVDKCEQHHEKIGYVDTRECTPYACSLQWSVQGPSKGTRPGPGSPRTIANLTEMQCEPAMFCYHCGEGEGVPDCPDPVDMLYYEERRKPKMHIAACQNVPQGQEEQLKAVCYRNQMDVINMRVVEELGCKHVPIYQEDNYCPDKSGRHRKRCYCNDEYCNDPWKSSARGVNSDRPEYYGLRSMQSRNEEVYKQIKQQLNGLMDDIRELKQSCH